MLTALYLLSQLVVEGKEDAVTLEIGASGTVCLALTFLLSIFMLNRVQNEHTQRQSSGLEVSNEIRSQKTFSIGNAEENALLPPSYED